MAAVLETGDTQTAQAAGTSVAVTKPTNLANDDYVVLVTGDADDNGTITSSGFTALVDESGNGMRVAVLYKKITNAAGEPSTYTVSYSGTVRAGCLAHRVSGADGTTFITTTGARATGSSTSPAATTMTASTTGELCLRFGFAEGQSGGNPSTDWSSHDTDFTEDTEAGGSGGAATRRMSVCTTYDASNASTTVNDTGSTLAASSSWTAFIIEVNPASAGTQDITPALTQQLATATAPTFTIDTTPGLAQQLATTFAPTFAIDMTPGLAQQLAAGFDPTLTPGAVDIAPALAQQLAAGFDPTVANVGSVQDITAALVQQLAAATDPSLSIDVTPGLAQQLATATDPSLSPGPVDITPALEQQLATSFAPSFAIDITAALVQQLATAYDPTQIDRDIAVALVQQLAAGFDPTVSLDTSQDVTPGLAQQLAAGFDPTVTPGAVDITPALAQQLAAAYAPAFGLDIAPALQQQLATTFDPTVAPGAADITAALVQQLLAAYDPTVSTDAQIIAPDLVQRLITAYGPTVGIIIAAVVEALATARDRRPDLSRAGRPGISGTPKPAKTRSSRVR